MTTSYETRYASSPEAVKKYDMEALRKEFLVSNLMGKNKIHFVYTHYDRYMVGSAVPLDPLKLETIDPLKSSSFLERREMGIINVGESGSITIDGTTYDLGHKDALYIGMGAKLPEPNPDFIGS